ncbi:MAG: hypothetical protein COA58_13590 [Bacteroidetes bacterium]|nr:MAG: hypothetical protein COA58_13590 [Bacteroidota bacterium]
MKRYLLVLGVLLCYSSVFSQISIVNFHYKVSNCSYLDSSAFYKINSVEYPKYTSGDFVFVEDLRTLMTSKKFKKKDEGTYTAVINKDWDNIIVSSTSEKVSDKKLFLIAKMMRESKPNWRPLIANKKIITDFTFTISFEVWVED